MRMNKQQLLGGEQPVPWLELLETLVRRRRLVVTVSLLGILLAAAVAWSEPTLYRATAQIQLTAKALGGPRVEAMTDRQILAELAMLKSPALLRTMLEDEAVQASTSSANSGLGNRFRRTGLGLLTAPIRWFGGATGPAAADRQIESWAGRIEIARVLGSNVVKVAFVDESPQFAADFVNALLVNHIKRIVKLGERTVARAFYETQAEILAERWREASAALLSFRREHGAEVSQGEIQRIVSDLEARHVATETEALELEATIDFLTEQLTVVSPTVEGELLEKRDESVAFLKARLIELRIKRIEYLASYTPDSTVVRDLDRQIKELQELLSSNQDQFVAETLTEPNPSHQALEVQLLQTRARLNATRARLQALDTQIGIYREKRARIEQVVGELSRLESAAKTAKEDHETYLRRIEGARLESALDATGSVNVSILENAEPRFSPLPTNRPRKLVLGSLLAVVIAIACAFARDLLDPTLKSSRQIVRLTGLPVIAEIPLDTGSAGTS